MSSKLYQAAPLKTRSEPTKGMLYIRYVLDEASSLNIRKEPTVFNQLFLPYLAIFVMTVISLIIAKVIAG